MIDVKRQRAGRCSGHAYRYRNATGRRGSHLRRRRRFTSSSRAPLGKGSEAFEGARARRAGRSATGAPAHAANSRQFPRGALCAFCRCAAPSVATQGRQSCAHRHSRSQRGRSPPACRAIIPTAPLSSARCRRWLSSQSASMGRRHRSTPSTRSARRSALTVSRYMRFGVAPPRLAATSPAWGLDPPRGGQCLLAANPVRSCGGQWSTCGEPDIALWACNATSA
jgi:hypothetical protein